MAAVSEWIVREYFEAQGFLVQQPRKYVVAARSKRIEEEIDLVVFNPHAQQHETREDLLWRGTDLRKIKRAVVGVRGWHTDRFSVTTLKLSPEILRFAEADVVRQAEQLLGEGPVAKILCAPDLPASGRLRQETLDYLHDKGVDGIILFRNMLLELTSHVEANRSYEKSDLLQVLRILKNYGLLKDSQMELFGRKRKRK